MKMTVSVNNQSGVPYVQYGTDKQKAKAAKFVNANNKDLTKLAYDITDRKNRDRKFDKNVGKVILSLPLIGAAAAAITTKGKVSAKTVAASKSFAKTAGAMAVVGGVALANGIVAGKSEKVAKAEKKHPILTLAGITAIATGAVMGAESLVNKISPAATKSLKALGKKMKVDKFAAKLDTAPAAVRTAVSNLTSKVSLPKGVKENLSKISSKIKVPQSLKNATNSVKDLAVTKNIAKSMKNVGKLMLKNPITSTVALVGAAMIANGVKKSVEVSQTKAKLKEAQMHTASDLVKAYAAENESLKMANAKAADALDKGQSIVNNDNVDAE